ncbi:MAG: DNA mismatch repair protein MutS, partial [Candidatus Marinamargulisbacteria bacterium]
MTPSSHAETPMIRQYKAIKANHQDAILFFRMGDFYEMFFEDAKTASRELSLTLTGRGKEENRIPMCGIPHHAADNYVKRLVLKGYKVAICEQVEDAVAPKTLAKREVVKIVTPGTAISHDVVAADENNFLVGIAKIPKSGHFAVSYVDVSTGEFKLFTCDTHASLRGQLDKLDAKECVLDDTLSLDLPNILINRVTIKSTSEADRKLARFFDIQSLDTFGIGHLVDAYPTAWALIDYLETTQKNALPQINTLLPHNLDETLYIDPHSIQNLELTRCVHTQEKQGSLFWVLDHTKTAMGGRRLNRAIKNPSVSLDEITDRLDAVDQLKTDLLSREEIRDILTHVYDLERLLSKIVSHHHNPRD